ncbi:MAG TPA: 2-succinyl-5-enolpyruvyl-6-hydroxy-3-cyclohexene-1-carboxylic-acid synthase [Polyangiaceae bacterium]|nr:2-succinyl-5-enolpyruvyl-6-hydroxy-3-cyclohexene-1-carboxylic-acid synthase [Polyangiaceae bacterium]
MADPDLLTQWALLLVSSLEDLGVTHAVLSPGSRSTPLTWAFSQSSKITSHLVIDERSAGFFALGQAKQHGQASVLVCTSGSAAANYLPALVEASQSHTPLLVITADRPYELQQCDAPQTIDQVKLFGDFVRGFFDLGLPDASLGSLRGLRRTVSQALALSESPSPGPVHLNFRARKPLEPVIANDSALSARVKAVRSEPLRRPLPPRVAINETALQELAQRCAVAQRGVITLGPRAPSAPSVLGPLRELLAVCNLTVLVESTSQARHLAEQTLPSERVCDAFDWLYATERGAAAFTPDFVLQLGAPVTSGSWQQLLNTAPHIDLTVLQECGWSDPSSRARTVLQGSVGAALTALSQQLRSKDASTARGSWHQQLAAANQTLWNTVRTHLTALPSEPLAEPVAVNAILDALPGGSLLAVGNSLPVREIDLYSPGMTKSLRVLSQRGANGIDGLISGAAGAASLHDGPTVCLVGDISFLHDVGGLWAARDLTRPFVVVVLNNSGGRIFEQLPLLREGTLTGAAAAPWLTPHDLQLDRAAQLFGLPGQRVDSLNALKTGLAEALARSGASVLEVRVLPSSASQSHQTLIKLCETALSQLAS